MKHGILSSGFLAILLLASCGKSSEQAGPAPESTPDEAETIVAVVEPDSADPAEAEGILLEGMFRYMADAPLFRDCRTGKTFPVAMAGPYSELESAYLNSGIAPGEELAVTLHGRLLERPAMEENGSEIMVIVDSFDGISDSSDCIPEVDADLINTYWKLLELDGEPVDMQSAETAPQREPHMVLAMEDSRVHGFTGCNNFFGKYQLEDNRLQFSMLGATRMACEQGMDTEQAFLTALGETERASVSGLFLELYSGDTLLARFEAVYLP